MERITYYHRHKAVVRDWYGNGLTTSLEGKVEFIQETEFSSSSILTELTGLAGQAGKFGIHIVIKFYANFIQFFSNLMQLFLQILCKFFTFFLQILCKFFTILCKFFTVFLLILCEFFYKFYANFYFY